MTGFGTPRSRHRCVNALDGVAITVSSAKNDRHLAYLSKPLSGLDPFAASFKANVHQDNIGLIFHCTQKDILCICR